MSATVGATSTTPAASSADLPPPAPARPAPGLHLLGHPPPRAGFGALGGAGARRPVTRRRARRGAGRRRRRPALDRRRRPGAARGPPRLRRRRARAGRVRPPRRVQPGVAGGALGARARRGRRGDRPPARRLARGGDDGAPAMRRGGGPPVDPLGDLAAVAGEPDAERWWEDLVEHRGDGEPVFDAVGEAMAAVREGTTTPPFDARREAHMRRRVRAALAAGRHRGRRVRGVARAGARPGRSPPTRPTRPPCGAGPR